MECEFLNTEGRSSVLCAYVMYVYMCICVCGIYVCMLCIYVCVMCRSAEFPKNQQGDGVAYVKAKSLCSYPSPNLDFPVSNALE